VTNVLGVTVRIAGGRPHLRGVVLDDSGALVRTFEHKCSQDDEHEMLHALGQAFGTELAAQDVGAVLIRESGYSRGAGLTGPTKARLRGEGVALVVARRVTRVVVVADAKGIGQLMRVDAASADADGKALAGAIYAEAAAAALGALKL
jgi:hypothetical protein